MLQIEGFEEQIFDSSDAEDSGVDSISALTKKAKEENGEKKEDKPPKGKVLAQEDDVKTDESAKGEATEDKEKTTAEDSASKDQANLA